VEGKAVRVLPLRSLALKALCGSWHPAVDLRAVPNPLAFAIYERLRAQSSPLACASLYPFVAWKWQLSSLDLSDCRDWIQDHSLAALNYIASLETFALVGSALVRDLGMGFLARQRSLREVDVSWCPGVTDAFLRNFGHLSGTLRALNLTGTGVTDAGISSLLPLVGLQRLGLGSTALSDTGMEYLTYYSRYATPGQPGLHQLEWLSLASTRITDSSLGKLCAVQGGVVFKKLRLLVLGSNPCVGGRAVSEVRLKYKFIAPLPNAPRTLASTNRDAMMGEQWITRIAPSDDRKQAASRQLDSCPSEADWLADGLKHYVLRYTHEAGAQRQQPQPSGQPLGAGAAAGVLPGKRKLNATR
jgi:hypothetical protein